jgi:1-acyl-sn-glycerol-3-phosphate acyltransferase
LRWLYRLVDAIPVERSGRDLGATRAGLRALERGRVLGLFPEGRIASEGQILPLQTGIALLATRSGAPVYPMYIEGTVRFKDMLEAFLMPSQVTVAFGEPVRVDRGDASREVLESTALRIRDAMVALGCKVIVSQVAKMP